MARRVDRRPVSKHKAGEILKHGEVKGKKLTPKQKRFFGFIRGGGIPTKRRVKRGQGRGGHRKVQV